MLILWLVRVPALLLAALVMTVHVLAFTNAEVSPRLFDGELLGVNINRAFAASIAISLTSLQIILPIELSLQTDRSSSYRIAACLLTTMFVAGGWLISTALFHSSLAPTHLGLPAIMWLGTEIAATVLQALAWCPPASRPQPISQSPERAADPASVSPFPSWGPFEQRLLAYFAETFAPGSPGCVGGELVTTQAALAAQIGCSKSTVNAALHALAAGRVIRLETTARQTRVRPFDGDQWERWRPVANRLPSITAPVSANVAIDGPVTRSSEPKKRASFGSERTSQAGYLAAVGGLDFAIVRLFASVRTVLQSAAHGGTGLLHSWLKTPQSVGSGAS